MREIRLICFDRPDETRQCVQHLLRCHYFSSWYRIASIDGQPDGSHNAGVVEALKDFPGEVILRPRLGMNEHIRTNFAESNSEYYFHLEDDILLAKDALLWAEFSARKFNSQYGAYCCMGNDEGIDKLDEYTSYHRFCAYGTLICAFAMRRILNSWRGEWSYWDCGISDLWREWNWTTCMPQVTRARNIGYPPGSPLGQAMYRSRWSDDFT